MSRLDEPLGKALGARTAKALEAGLELRTVGDLLRHYPRRYASRGELTDLSSLVPGEHVTVVGEVVKISSRPMKARRGFIAEAVVTDGHGEVRLTFFAKQSGMAGYWERALPRGTRALFAGKVDKYRGHMQLVHPEFHPLPGSIGEDEARAMADELIPIYPASAKVQSWTVAQSVRVVLDTLGPDDVPDPLPTDIRARQGGGERRDRATLAYLWCAAA